MLRDERIKEIGWKSLNTSGLGYQGTKDQKNFKLKKNYRPTVIKKTNISINVRIK